MREFLLNSFDHFDRSDFLPGKAIKEPLLVFLVWALPSFTFVIWSNTYYPDVVFYQEAITEGIGPNLWNAIGSFGLFCFGLALIFSRFSGPAIFAKQILSNTYAIGSLTLGLLLGQWFLLPTDELVWWQQGLFGITSSLLIFIVFLYNLSVWYLGFLLRTNLGEKTNFIHKLEQMHLLWRIFIGAFICYLVFLIFQLEA